jgi:fermentation-respiration switch protein FrsA (DUF1100 family)
MALCDRFFYYPTRREYAHPRDYGLKFEPVEFSGLDGVRLTGWFFPAVGQAIGTVVHCHGNAGNVSGHFECVHWLPAAGWNVLCFDYRGYGRSSGRPTRRGTIDDAHAALRYVRGRSDVDGDSVVLLGQSIGGAVGIVAAAEGAPVRAVVIDGAFDSYRGAARWALAHQWYTWGAAWPASRWLISAGWDPIDYVGRVRQPKLFVQGTVDPIIDWHAAERLHERAREPKELLVIEGAGHSDAFEVAPDVARPKVLDFIGRWVRAAQASGQETCSGGRR